MVIDLKIQEYQTGNQRENGGITEYEYRQHKWQFDTETITVNYYEQEFWADMFYIPQNQVATNGTVFHWECIGTTRRNYVSNGEGGFTIENWANSQSCNYTPPVHPVAGTFLENACNGLNRQQKLADGNGGFTWGVVIEENSLTCGYEPPVECVASFPFVIEKPAAIRFFMQFENAAKKKCRVNWYEKGWEDLPESVCYGEGAVNIEWPGTGDKLGVLSGSGATFSVLIDRYGLLQSFYTSDERKYRVEYLEDDELIWQGWHMPDIYREPWISTNFVSTVTAYDGIGALGNIYYLDEAGSRYYGRARTIDVIARCLRKLDLTLPLWVSVNVWENTMDKGITSFAQSYIDQNVFYDKDNEPLSCAEVLELVLKPYNAFLKQANGALHIIRYSETNGPYTRRKVILGRKDSELRIDVETETIEDIYTIRSNSPVKYLEGGQFVESRPALKYISSELEYGEYENFLYNGDFERWNGQQPLFWEGDISVSRSVDTTGTKFELEFLELLSTAETSTKTIKNSRYPTPVSSASGFTFSFDYYISIDDYFSESGNYWEREPEFSLNNSSFRITNLGVLPPVGIINDTQITFPGATTVTTNINIPQGLDRRIDVVVAKSNGTYEYIFGTISSDIDNIPALPDNALVVTYISWADGKASFSSVSDLFYAQFQARIKIGNFYFYSVSRETGNVTKPYRFLSSQREVNLYARDKNLQDGLTVLKGTFTLKSISLTTPGRPEVTFLTPRLARNSMRGVYVAIDNVKLTETPLSNVDKMIITDENAGIINTPPLKIELKIGSDTPLTNSLLTLVNGERTRYWGDTQLPLQGLLVKEVKEQHKRPTLALNATIRGNISPITLLKDPFQLNSRFLIDRYVYRARENMIDVVALEIFGGAEDFNPIDAILTEGRILIYSEDFDYLIRE